MTQSVQVVSAKIERIVRGKGDTSAEFVWLRPSGAWLCTQAWFDEGPHLNVRGTPISPEEAAVVCVAIQMAIDWLTEETVKRAASPPVAGTPTKGDL